MNKNAEKKRNRIERSFMIRAESLEREDGEQELWVNGYAAVFDSPTVLYELEGNEYREQICAGAFDEAKMDDVIFNYNHGGKVMARTRNHTLQLEIDEKGLKISARLDGTEEGRRLYEEISGGYIDRMSFAFTVAEETFDEENLQWNIRKIKRLYDVSAVDFPAYEDTTIDARRNSILEAIAREADAQAESEREAAADLARRKLMLKLRLNER